VLLATENAPPGKRAWYGMFPQLGAPIGFLFSGSVYLALTTYLSDEQFFNFGWRIPFLASAALVIVGLYVRLTITETPIFAEAVSKHVRVKIPVVEAFHTLTIVKGILISMVAYMLFYMMSVFTLSWATSKLGYSRQQFLLMQLVGILFFAATIPFAGRVAEHGRRKAMTWMMLLAIAFGFVMPPLFAAGTAGAVAMLCIGFAMTGLVYGPLGTVLSELFPTKIRYTGSSIAFNVAGIFGASLAPYAATYLATNYGLPYVGYYISGIAALSLAGLLATKETKDEDLRH
jgi:MFS family permease